MELSRKHIETPINFANIAERSTIISISICGLTTTTTIITTPRGV